MPNSQNPQLTYPEKRSKIVCTIGPASWDKEVMTKMIAAGMNVARVNGAFADTAELERVENLVRSISNKVGLMIDVKGPEVRLNKFAAPLPLELGQVVEFGSSDAFPIYPANYPETYKYMKVGQKIMVGDGDVQFEVTEVTDKSFLAKVVAGELLKPGKALNFPGLMIFDNPLTEKDLELLNFSIEHNWDFVSASFIRTAKDAQVVRASMKKNGQANINNSKMRLIAKIEDSEGLANIADILNYVDGILLARGGLGVDMGLTAIPSAERKLLQEANKALKPIIYATQMLESMTNNSVPTRAEATDVAFSIWNKADSMMLSAESSAGKFPVEAVDFLSRMENVLRSEVEPILPENLGEKAPQYQVQVESLYRRLTVENYDRVFLVTDDLRLVEIVGKLHLDERVTVLTTDPTVVTMTSLVGGIVGAEQVESIEMDRIDAEINQLYGVERGHVLIAKIEAAELHLAFEVRD